MRPTMDEIVYAMESLFYIQGEELSERLFQTYQCFTGIWEPKTQDEVYDTIKGLVAGFVRTMKKEYRDTSKLDGFETGTACINVGYRNPDGESSEVYIEFQHGVNKFL